jgi:hypothetical protein
MHLANFTAFGALAATLLLWPLPVPVAAGALEPHALITAPVAIRARAPSGRRLLLMCPPAGRALS